MVRWLVASVLALLTGISRFAGRRSSADLMASGRLVVGPRTRRPLSSGFLGVRCTCCCAAGGRAKGSSRICSRAARAAGGAANASLRLSKR